MTEIDLIKRNTKCLCVTFFSRSFISLKLFDVRPFPSLPSRLQEKKRHTMVQKKVTQRIYSLGGHCPSSTYWATSCSVKIVVSPIHITSVTKEGLPFKKTLCHIYILFIFSLFKITEFKANGRDIQDFFIEAWAK